MLKKKIDLGLCESCPGFETCAVPKEILTMIHSYSGLDGIKNQMEIKVKRCHHKVRLMKEQNSPGAI